MSKTIKEVKDFTKRLAGSAEVVVDVSGTEVEIDSMALIRSEGGDDVVVLYASVPVCEEAE